MSQSNAAPIIWVVAAEAENWEEKYVTHKFSHAKSCGCALYQSIAIK